MGAVFRPKDIGKGGYRKVIENSIRDLHPDTQDGVARLLDSWKGTRSEERLKEILGYDKAQELLKCLNAKKEEHDNLNV